jgi:tetratricopeptide (TPR) repeat protein
MQNASQESVARYEAYLKADPDNPHLLVALGDLYHRSGKFDQALGCYEKCLAGNPEHSIALSRVASVLISQHRFVEAERALRRALSAGEPDAALLHNLGLSLYCQQRWAEALDAFRQAQALGLDAIDNVRYRTYALHHLGDTEHAIEACKQWLERDPGEAVNGYLAILEMDHGDMPSAHQRAEAVLAKHPDNPDAALVQGMWLTEHQEIDSARGHFEAVVRAEPENPRGWLGIGLVRLYQEETAAAIEAIETAFRQMPKHVGTLVTLGWAKFANRDLAGAEQTFRQAIALDRNFGEAHGGLAITLVFLKRYGEARRATRLALKLNPQGFGAIYAQGALLALDGKRPEGEAKVAKALLRSVTADGLPLIEHVRTYLRRQMARASAPQDDSERQR